MKGITQSQVRDILDEVNIPSRIDSDGNLYTVLPADDDFGYDVAIYFVVHDDSLLLHAFAVGLNVPEPSTVDVLVGINELAIKNKFPKAYIYDHTIMCDHWVVLDEEVSPEYVRENCIRMIIPFMWGFFVKMQASGVIS